MADLPRLAGGLVALPLGWLAALRHGKPMHPRGAVFDAVLERRGSRPRWDVPWLDETAEQPAQVRLSRAAGLPEPLPDVLGLAVRIRTEDGPVDLLLSSTGTGPLDRFLLLPRRDAACPYTSIMGYRCGARILRLAALPERDGVPSEPRTQALDVAARPLSFTLAAADGTAGWRPFARLSLRQPVRPLDPGVRFDPVLHAPPGLVADGPIARLREPSYAAARARSGG